MLICSDGLSGELTNEQISGILLARPDPQSAADSLVHEAICAGGRDNITVVVIDATGVPQDSGGEYTGPRDLVALTDEDTLPQDVRLQMGGLS
jgi:protein phosphatase